MGTLAQRSQEKERIDLGHYELDEYIDCLKKLFYVNKLLGVFKSTVKIFKRFPQNSSVLDIGCGGGLFLLHLSKYFPSMKLQGIDINAQAIQEAQCTLTAWQKNQNALNVSFQLQQQCELEADPNSIDIILTTFVCHHLSDSEIIRFLQQAHSNARLAVIIHDLHRHRIAQWFFFLFSPILFRNKLITHDGLISIRRSFTRIEWRHLLQKANIPHYKIKWEFPFRWNILIYK